MLDFIYSLKGKQSLTSVAQAMWCSSGLLPAGGDALLSVSPAVTQTPAAGEPWFQPEGPAHSVRFRLNI